MTLWKWRLFSIVAALMAGLWTGFFSVLGLPLSLKEMAVAVLIVSAITYAAMHVISLGGTQAMARWKPWVTAFVVLTTALALLLIVVLLTSRGVGDNFGL